MSVAILDRPHITPRELEVIQWVVEGKTAEVISTILGISYITVNNHISSARMKLGAVSSAHLVAKALIGGIIPMKPTGVAPAEMEANGYFQHGVMLSHYERIEDLKISKDGRSIWIKLADSEA